MIPAHGYAVATGDTIDARSVAKTALESAVAWLNRRGWTTCDTAHRDDVERIFRTIGAREDARIVEVMITHHKPPARSVRAVAVEQEEVTEGEYP